MARVFVVQDLGKVSFAVAEPFGELTVLIPGRVSHMLMRRSYAQLRDRMRLITKQDWLIPAGHPTLIGLACIIQAQFTGQVRILSWDHQAGKYIPSEIEI